MAATLSRCATTISNASEPLPKIRPPLQHLPSSSSAISQYCASDSYREAIDATGRVIGRRAWAYRNLVVAVSLLGLGALGWALWWRSGQPLTLLLLFASLCIGFLWHDRRLLNSWRDRLLADWTMGVLDFAALRGALLANPALPRDTVAAMVDSLPDGGDLRHERAMSLRTREAVALSVRRSDRAHAVGLALAGLAAFLAAATCLLAVLFETWWPLLGLLPAIPIADGCSTAPSRVPRRS